MFRSLGLGLLLWQLVTATGLVSSQAQPAAVTVKIFLSDGNFQMSSSRPSPLNLGSYPYECVGNVQNCPNGFSLGLWYRQSLGSSQTPYSYVLSSGAQSAQSPAGIYLRQNYGEEYEAAVAIQLRLWSVPFNLIGIGSWTHIAMTFTSSAGLTVYVDGQAVGMDKSGTTRMYAASDFNQFTDIVVGQANDVQLSAPTKSIGVWNIVHADTKYEAVDIQRLTANVTNGMLIGCSNTKPDGTFSAGSTASLVSQSLCRGECYNQRLGVAVYQSAMGCDCTDYTSWSNSLRTNAQRMLQTCTGNEPFQVVWATHQSFYPVVIPINLVVTAIYPVVTRKTLYPDETLTFQMSSSTSEEVTYRLNFGDGSTSLVTTGTQVGYSWSVGGQYTVNVTAITRSNVESRTLVVSVVAAVNTGTAPTDLAVKADWDGKTDFGITAYVAAYSDRDQQCTINYGDASTASSFQVSGGSVLSTNTSHAYPNLGLYPVTLTCINQFGAANATGIAPGVKSYVPYASHAQNVDITLAVTGASTGLIQAAVDGSSAPAGQVDVNSTHVVLDAGLFPTVGEHSIALTQSLTGLTLLKTVFNVLPPVDGVQLTTKTPGVTVGEPMTVTLKIQRGSAMFVTLSYGDGQTDMVYLTSAPATVTRSHAYSALGPYTVTATVASDVGAVTSSTVAYVERKIVYASMATSNVTSLNTPTNFSFVVDPTLVPAMPIRVDFDYGDGNDETVLLMPPYIHSYTYSRYGIYHVEATVLNNVSTTSLPVAILQVGENLTALDVRVNNSLVGVNQNVLLVIDCPTGSPVDLKVDMGDGLPALSFKRPTNYSPATDDFVDPETGSSKNSTGTTTRRRRDATQSNVGAPFSVFYQYKKPGRYSVKVSSGNSLSNVTSHLCPDVVVIATPSSMPSCRPSVTIAQGSPLSQPTVAQRSSVVKIGSANVKLQCTPSSASLIPLYTWTVDRQVAGGKWRPELSVCVNASSTDSTLVIPSNTLWYGTYRVNVTVSASIGGTTPPLPVSLDRSPASTTYLTIVPTPLVANITVIGGDLVDGAIQFYSNATVSMDMSSSGDPDVAPGNATGYNMYVFCYPQQNQSTYGRLTLTDLLASATNLTNNILQDATLYQFAAAPCFSTYDSNSLWVLDYEVHFPSPYLIADIEVVFAMFVTKDVRSANDSVLIKASPYGSSNLTSALDDIDRLLRSGDTGAALAVMNMVTAQLNSGSDDADAVAERTKMRGQLIGALGTVSTRVASIDQVGKTAGVMSSIVAKPSEVKEEDKAAAASAVNNTASAATILAGGASEGAVSDITQSMLNGVGNILPFAPPDSDNSSSLTTVGPTTTTRKMGPSSTTTTASPSDDGNSTETPIWPTCCQNLTTGLCDWVEPVGWMCVDEDDRKKTVWTEEECLLVFPDDINSFTDRFNAYNDYLKRKANALKKTITTQGMGAFDSMGSILIGKQGDGAGKTISSPNINMTVVKVDQQLVNNARRRKREGESSVNVNGINMPADAVLQMGAGGGFQNVISPNAYTYCDTCDTNNNQVSGNVKSLALTGADGKPIDVSHSDHPFELWFDANPVLPEASHFNLVGNATGYHRVNISDNGTALLAVIQPGQPGVTLAIYIKRGDYPNATYYDELNTLPNAPSSGRSKYLYYPSMNVTALNDSYVIGITVNSTSSGGDVSLGNYTYSMYFYTAACRFWNESIDNWDTAGCEVGNLTTSARTQCLCTHLTSFGGGFAVPPNTIDFATVFTAAKFLESIPVFSTVISFIAVWVIICIWARHMDKKDIARWGAVPLEDNVPCDTYFYELSVYTGLRKNAGTSSKPSFILSGDDGDTGVRVLCDGKRKEHSTGSINNYILSVEEQLGALTFLRVWHDNNGKGTKRGWFLDQIHVTDLQTGEKFFFVCNRWMAVEEDDGQIERIIPVAGANDLTQFGTMFTQSIRKKFSNDHMWASIFSRPTRSTFTRVQRVSSCVALLFLTMITNCMFFKSSDPDHATEVHIGPITLTAQQIYISVVSTLIVLPPSVAIVTIFRKVRPKNNAIQSEKSVKAGGNKPGGWVSINPGSSLWKNGEGIDKQTRMQKMRDAVKKITTFHKRSKYSGDNDDGQADDEDTAVKKKKQPMTFPHWTIYIAWGLVVLSVAASGFFTILYSMQWGHTKSMDWLQTFLLSFVQNVIVVQPAKVFLLAMFLSCVLKKPDVEDEEIPGGDNSMRPDEEAMAAATTRSQQDIQAILKRRRASQPGGAGLGLPNQEQLKKDREARLKQLEMDAIIRECVIYIFFVLITYFISYQDRDKRSYNFSQNIQNNFFGSMDQIQTYDDVYNWLNGSVFPNLYSNGWYNGKPPISWRDKQQMNDHVTIRLGIGRMRQLRIKDNTCKVLKDMRSLITHCRTDYNWMDDDTKSYAPDWLPRSTLNKTEECLAFEKPYDVWRYRNTVELRGSPYAGKINTYKGGGYVFNFRRDVETTLIKFNELASTNWLDVRTRAVFVEFTLYNGNANLFASVIMLIEFLATGGPSITQEVKIFRLSSYVGPFGIIVVLFQVIFVGFIIYFMVRTVRLIRKQKCEYFKSFWNCLELCTMITSIIAILMYAMKLIMGNTAMDVLKEAGSGEYVNFVTIATWAEMFSFLLAFVVFMATIKFINMLKFNRRMAMLADTIRVCTKDLKSFVITFFIYFMAFVQFGYLLFGSQLPAYASVTQTIQTLFNFVLGQFDFIAFLNAQPFLGPIYFFLYVIIVGIALQAMFLTIICEAFQVVRRELDYKKNDYEVGDYIMSKFMGVVTTITGDRYSNAGRNPGEVDSPSASEGSVTHRRRADREVGEGGVEVGFD